MKRGFPQGKEKKHLFIAALLLLLYLSPMLIFGEKAHMRIHDNLDSNVAWYSSLADHGQIVASLSSTIPQIMNAPRDAFPSQFTGILWLYAVFSPFVAYTISQVITVVFAFIGMYLLLKRFFIKAQSAYVIRIYISVAFAITPFWPPGMLSMMGMPLALWAFLTIRKHQASFREWLVITLLPFYSSFVLGFFFFLVVMAILWLRDLIVKRNLNLRFLSSIAYMTVLYCLIDYRLFISILSETGAESHRNAFIQSTNTLPETIQLFCKNYFLGHFAVPTLHLFVIVPISFLALSVVIRAGNWRLHRDFITLFVFNIILSLWYAFWFYEGWQPLKEQFSLLTTFNFARFHFLRPMVLYLLFAVSCLILWRLEKAGRIITRAAIITQLIILFIANPEIVYRYIRPAPSFQAFYAEDEFAAIAEAIGKPQDRYKVVSIGMHPAIAEFNGFYTADGYVNAYPLQYKKAFRPVIEPELEKSPSLKKYFDTWGSRCYVFSSELGKHYGWDKHSSKVIEHLEIRSEALLKLGAEYVLSAVPIENAAENNLVFVDVFTDKNAAWEVYLYQIASDTPSF